MTATPPQLVTSYGYPGITLALLVAIVALVVVYWRWIAGHRDTLWMSGARLWRRVHAVLPLARRAPGRGRAAMPAHGAERFTPGEYFTMHVALGFALSLVALVLFAALSEGAVLHRGTLAHFDAALLATLHQAATPSGATIAGVASALGSVPVMSALGIAVAVVLAMGRRRLLLAGWAVALVGSALLTSMLKVLVHRPHPVFTNPLMPTNSTWSFPSGHALGALVAYGLVVYLLSRAIASHRWHVALAVTAFVLVTAIGLARLYLGVHYFSEIMAGYAAGAVWLATVITGLEVARRSTNTTGRHRVEDIVPAARHSL